MTGRGHLATGAAMLMDMAAFAALSVSGNAGSVLSAVGTAGMAWLSPWHALGGGVQGAAGCAAGLALYALGLLLPDIDNKGSTICKATRLCLAVNHRGWTHSIWAVLPAAALSTRYMPFLWLAIGMLAHDLADALSQAGWVPFYPIGRWRTYHGTVMRRGWTPGLYSSSRPGSEDVAAGVLSAIGVVLAGFMLYLAFWPKGGGLI